VYDPYEDGIKIIDTDYDNFMITYKCIEEESEDFENQEHKKEYELIM